MYLAVLHWDFPASLQRQTLLGYEETEDKEVVCKLKSNFNLLNEKPGISQSFIEAPKISSPPLAAELLMKSREVLYT